MDNLSKKPADAECAVVNPPLKGGSNLELNPFYVTGYSDGEACFHLAIGKNTRYKLGYYVNPGFTITVHKKDREILTRIQKFFGGIGVVQITSRKHMIQFRVFSIQDLNIILNHFDQYPLITKKCADYLLFKEALALIKNKKHLTIEGFNEILAIRASMNKGLPENLRESFPYITGKSLPLVRVPDHFNPHWVAGFIEAEGCFFVKSNSNNNRQFVLGCQITQHSRDSILMKNFSAFFNCGRLETTRGLYVNYIITKLSDINKIIIPFLEKYPVLGSKSKDFLDWKRIAELMSEPRRGSLLRNPEGSPQGERAHLTNEGAEDILRIKSNMNASRIEEE
jgi:hypothetical protein